MLAWMHYTIIGFWQFLITYWTRVHHIFLLCYGSNTLLTVYLCIHHQIVHNSGPINVNLEFSFSFAGFSFSGLDQNIYVVSNPRFTSYVCEFLFSQQLVIVCLCFSTRLSSQNLSFELFFSALWLSNLELWVSTSIFLGFQKPGFQTLKVAIFWFTLISPV